MLWCVRTTLTIDDDVAASLARLQKTHRTSFRKLVNDLLRRGLRQMSSRTPPRKRHETVAVDLGRCHLGNLDDVAEALAVAEGDSFK